MSRAAEDLEHLDFEPATQDLLDEVKESLSRVPKRLPPKLFYDRRGSELFDQITELPEYYPTRTEIGILEEKAEEIARFLGKRCRLVEFGAGSTRKVRILLDHLEDVACYVPIDISGEHLLTSAQSVANDYPNVPVIPVVADYLSPFELPDAPEGTGRTSGFFPGSTIGNFERSDARRFLRTVREIVGDDGGLVLGADLHKKTETIERAYNDASGVTAEFNTNALRVANEKLATDFDVDRFEHRAVYDEDERRIEMRLICDRDHAVQVGDEKVQFKKGEHILTEYSHKYRLEDVEGLAKASGFSVEHVWCDPDRKFSVQYLRAAPLL